MSAYVEVEEKKPVNLVGLALVSRMTQLLGHQSTFTGGSRTTKVPREGLPFHYYLSPTCRHAIWTALFEEAVGTSRNCTEWRDRQ